MPAALVTLPVLNQADLCRLTLITNLEAGSETMNWT